MEWAWRDQRKTTIRKFWMSSGGKHEERVVFVVQWRACAILLCECNLRVCVHVCVHLPMRLSMWSVVDLCVCLFFFLCTLSPPHAYKKGWMCECDSVCEPCRTPASCLLLKTKKRGAAEEPLLPLLWWKAALIEWPGTQPPFLIITAVQSLLITLKACRAPRSPVMLRAIRESEGKIRSFWQNPLSEKLQKRVEEEGRPQSDLSTQLVLFLSLSNSWRSRDAVCY